MDGVLSGLEKTTMYRKLIFHQVLTKCNGHFNRALIAFMVLLVVKPTNGILTWLKTIIILSHLPPLNKDIIYQKTLPIRQSK